MNRLILLFLLVLVADGSSQLDIPEFGVPEPTPQSPERMRLQQDDALQVKLDRLGRGWVGKLAASSSIIGADREVVRSTAWAMLRSPAFMEEFGYDGGSLLSIFMRL